MALDALPADDPHHYRAEVAPSAVARMEADRDREDTLRVAYERRGRLLRELVDAVRVRGGRLPDGIRLAIAAAEIELMPAPSSD